MLRLSKKADYALMAMKHLAVEECRCTSARTIAQSYGIPLELTAKILQKLVRKNLLRSRQGMSGGYELARNASSITVLDVIQAIDGPFRFTDCSEKDRHCAQFRCCTVRDPLWRVRDRIAQALGSYLLSDLATGGSG